MIPMTPKFEDPPPPRGRVSSTEWKPVVDALRAKTGEWALIGESNDDQPIQVLASQIRDGRGAWAGQPWQVATRKAGSGRETTYRIWVRHLDPADAHESEMKIL